MSPEKTERARGRPLGFASAGEIAADLQVEGLISSTEDLVVRGQVKGRLRSGRRLFIEPGARVDAEVEATEVVVRGMVRGRIRASERILLTSAADVEGDVEAPVIQIEEGARLVGRLLMRLELGQRGAGVLS